MKKVIILGSVIIAATSIYLVYGSRSNKEAAVRFVTVAVEKGDLSAEITCTGTLSPLLEVLVGSQVSGTIKELYADFESVVKKDQTIALIDPRVFEAKVAEARADLEAAKANLIKSEVTLADEMRNYARRDALLRAKSISQSEFDTAKTKADAAAAQAGVDRARVSQMEAKLQEAELQLQFTRIVTPVNGVVTSRNVDVGQTVAASFQAPVMFKIAEDLRKMQVNTNVDEADVGRVRVGQRAVFSVPAFPEEIFQASVRQIRNEPKVEQNVVTYNVVLDVDNSDLKLRPGMTANASIILERVQDALLVPDQVFRFNPPEKILRGKKLSNLPALKKGEKRIWTLGPDNLMRPVDVRTGISGSERVQVFSDDLKPGHRVVVSAETDKKSSLQRPGLRLGF